MGGQRVLHREEHRAHVTRAVRSLRDHAAVTVEDGDGEILALASLLGVGRPVHGGADLHRDRLERAPDDAEGDGIDHAHRVPTSATRFAYSSTVAVTPGGRTVVDSRSSTMAGPVSVMPAPRR